MSACLTSHLVTSLGQGLQALEMTFRACRRPHQYRVEPGDRLDIVYLLNVMPGTFCPRGPFV